MNEPRFRILFEKLAEAVDGESMGSPVIVSQETTLEYEEIDELRRLALEFAEPEPVTYTLT